MTRIGVAFPRSAPISRVLVLAEPAICSVMAQWIRSMGLHVWTASSTDEGLMAAFIQQPHAVFVQSEPSHSSALRFVRDLREMLALQLTSVTVMTSDYYLGEDEIQRIHAAGANVAYLPVFPDDVKSIIGKRPPSSDTT